MESAIVLVILLVVLVLFSTGRFSVDLVTLAMLVVLIVFGILSPAEALSGFGSDFVWMLAALFVVSGAFQQTGILDLLGSRLLKQARIQPGFLITWIMTSVGFTSAFMNNTTVTALFLAPVISVARRMNMSPSKLLIPVAYASILGGTCTLIGTSTNVAVSGYLEKHGFQGIGMFDLLPVGLVMFIIGLVYMVVVGKKLLPDHPVESLTEEFGLREYVSEIVISSNSPLIGQPVSSSSLSRKGFRILNVIRGSHNFIPDPELLLKENDILMVEGSVNTLMDVKEASGIEIRADALLDRHLQGDNIRLAEVIVTPQSDFLNNTLKEANFRHRYGLIVIAINRYGHTIREKIGRITLRVGDILLVQGPFELISHHKRVRDLNILEDFKPLLYRRKKGLLTISIFTAAILASIFGLLPASISFLVAAIVVVAAKAVSLEKAYETIDFRLLILIAGMTAMGTAMNNSGAAEWLSSGIISLLEPYGVLPIMTGFIILTVFLTQPMSNAAAALVVLPIALQTASKLGVNPQPFAIAVMLSASVSLVTPFEPSCLLVYTPGKYRFTDFFRTGFLLTVILMTVIVLMVPVIWPF